MRGVLLHARDDRAADDDRVRETGDLRRRLGGADTETDADR